MGVLVHLHDRFDPLKRAVYRLDKPVTVRRLVQRHKGLRKHTRVFRPGGVYGRRKVREFALPTVCLLNGKALARKEWKRATVGPSDVVAFYAPPTGGNGLRMIIGIVLAIAITVAAPYLGPAVGGFLFGLGGAAAAGSLAAAVGTAVVGVGLSAISFGVMSLFSQPAISQAGGTGFNNSTPASSPVYNLTAQGNFARLGQPIPEPMGRNRLFPDFVASPYVQFDTTIVSYLVETNDQYICQILGLGRGEYEIDEDSLKLGDTPITSYPDIEWAVIAPGDLSDTSIADERYITSSDLSDIELLDSSEGSPWAGPFAANPAGTTIDRIEVDTGAPRGLWAFNVVSSELDSREVEFEIEAQEIDDLGVAVGDPDTWEPIDVITYNVASQQSLRFTDGPFVLPSAGRWQVRVRRNDLKDTYLNSGHEFHWIGLRGRVVGRRRFPGMTCIALKMKAGPALTAAQSRQFNLVATRKLETWDSMAGAMGTVKAATRSPCDAFAYIARTRNGGRFPDSQIALADLYEHKADFETKGWTFDFVFDSGVTVSEALARAARAVIAERVVQGGKLHLVRDTEPVAPVAMFSPRNIVAGSFTKSYQMPDSTAPDHLIGTYIDQTVWRPIDVTVAFDDSAQERPTRVTLHGVGNRTQAREVLWHMAREDRYRRKVNGWSTGMEGLAVTYGDGISFSHDVPNYGQTLEAIDYDATDPNAPIFTVADIPDFSDGGATYYALIRDSKGCGVGPFVAVPVEGEEDQVQLTVPDPGDLPEILIGGDKERTWLQLGPGEAYAKMLKVKQVTPRGSDTAEIIAYDDDLRMYDPIPDEPEVPIGVDTSTPLTVAVTTSGNLRTKANAAGYSGLATQQVTFTVASDVDVALTRGSWPPGAEPIIELAGTLSGTTGAAGTAGAGGAAYVPGPAGNGQPGGTGGAGGAALNSSTGALVITGSGTIRGGKGGGGGGGGGGSTVITDGEGNPAVVLAGGVGGAGNGGSGASGGSLGGDEAGDGGDGGAAATDYGAAGAAGSAGTTGTLASTGVLYPGGAGGAGGAGGKAIVGVANVDMTGFTGLIVGMTS